MVGRALLQVRRYEVRMLGDGGVVRRHYDELERVGKDAAALFFQNPQKMALKQRASRMSQGYHHHAPLVALEVLGRQYLAEPVAEQALLRRYRLT